MSTPKKSQATKPAQGPLRIVAIGGGTGLSTVLAGLRTHSGKVEITAVVTVTDDGGSSGRLRRDFAVLPPGDIRNCLVALSEESALLSQLFQYRFESGRGLKGHSFGNLFLTALTHLTGDFPSAVRFASEVLASRGHIVPCTAENVVLEAVMEDGTRLKGESRISRSRAPIKRIHILPRRPKPLDATLQAIQEADLITYGPGSLFTSIIPNVLVSGIPEAIRNSKALKVFFTNLMWQPGETENFKASDHVKAMVKHSGIKAHHLIDYVALNSRPFSAPLLGKYAAKRALPVENDIDKLRTLGLRVVEADLLAESEKIRHSPERTAELAMGMARMGRRVQQISIKKGTKE